MLLDNPATFSSNIDDDIVISFTWQGKPTKIALHETRINDISDLIARFGFDSFRFDREAVHVLSPDQMLAVYHAILLAYSTH
jgi:hypothetical protein